ncbi:MAG: GNAT family N-acetyltransferase [Bacteroidia bacterium]
MYQTKRINNSLYKYLIELYKQCFNINIELINLSKKYNTRIFGKENIGFLAFNNNEPAAYYGVFPIILQYNNQNIIVAQSGDTMTSPKHQKKGLFILLANETYKLAKEENIEFVFGFPNENSYPGFKNKLEWIFTGNMKTFLLKTITIPVCEICFKSSILNKVYIQFIKQILASYIIKPEEINLEIFNYSKTKGRILHDLNFFSYKLNFENNFLIQYNNFYLFIKPENHLYIGDVGYFEENKTSIFIESLKKLGRKLMCKKIIISVSANHWLFSYLKNYISPQDDLPIGFKALNNHFEIDYSDIQFTRSDFDTF